MSAELKTERRKFHCTKCSNLWIVEANQFPDELKRCPRCQWGAPLESLGAFNMRDALRKSWKYALRFKDRTPENDELSLLEFLLSFALLLLFGVLFSGILVGQLLNR